MPRISDFFLFISCSLILAGCAAQPIFVPLPPTHPASPWACETPIRAQSNTLAIHKSEMMPSQPDWEIPGMRDNEFHAHAAGKPSPMDMMGHGHMMMHGDHGDNSGPMNEPGMVKMSAPTDTVDYAPEGAIHPNGPVPAEHQPEAHLDHVKERAVGYKTAPVAPPMDHSKMNHNMNGMDHMKMDNPEHEKNSMKNMDIDMGQSGHEGHNMGNMNMEDMQMNRDAPTTGSAAPMDHLHHEH